MEEKKKHNIIVYSTPTCPYCNMAKEYFKKVGFEFKNVNVAADQTAAKEMVEKSGQMGVPVTDIDGDIVIGFRPDIFKELLK